MIKKLRDIFVNLKNQLGQVIIDTFKATEKDALDYNKYQLNELGMKSDNSLMDEYSPVTVEIKRKKGTFISSHGRIALQDYGNFQDGMHFKTITQEYAEISSTDSKAVDLEDRYGSEIYGLMPEHVKEYAANEYKQSFLQKFKTFFK